MPLWLLANWRWLAPTAVAAMLGIWLGVTKLEVAELKLTIAHKETVHEQERTDAALVAAAAELAARNADNHSALVAMNAEEQHAKDIAAIDAGASDFDRRLRLARAGSCGSNGLPAPATDSAVPADIAERGDGEYRGIDSGTRLREVGLKLQTYVKLCNSWALSVGR